MMYNHKMKASATTGHLGFITHEPNKLANRLMAYNWEQKEWPDFNYNLSVGYSPTW